MPRLHDFGCTIDARVPTFDLDKGRINPRNLEVAMSRHLLQARHVTSTYGIVARHNNGRTRATRSRKVLLHRRTRHYRFGDGCDIAWTRILHRTMGIPIDARVAW